MINSVRAGDVLTMIGPDGIRSDMFTLAEVIDIRGKDVVWIFREYDAPIVLGRTYALDSTFELHSRRAQRRDRAS